MPFDPSQLMPFDLQAQQQQIQQQQALQQAFAQRAMQAPQGQMVSGHYISPGIGGAIGQLAQAGLSKFAGNRAMEANQGFQQDYSKRLGDELRGYLTQSEGTPGQTLSTGGADALMNGNVNPTLAEPVAGDPKEAMLKAMTSQFGQMQQIGQTGFNDYLASKKPHYVTTKAGEESGVYKNGVYTPIVTGAPESKISGERIWERGKDGKWVVAADARERYGDVKELGRDSSGRPIMGVVDTATNKPIYAPSGTTVNVNGPNPEGEFKKEIGKQAAERLKEGTAAATAASQSLDSMKQARDAMSDGMFTGAGAELKTNGARVLKALGLSDDAIDRATANTQTFSAAMAQTALASVKQLGANPSNADREYTDKAVGGQITMDKAALEHLMDIATAAKMNIIYNHQKNVNQAIGNLKDEDAKGYVEQSSRVPFTADLGMNGDGRVTFDENQKKFVTVGGPGPSALSPRVLSGGAPGGAKPPTGVITPDEWLQRYPVPGAR